LTTLGLIALGFAFPYLVTWLFSLFPKDTPDWVKGLVVAGGALGFCWDMTDSMVGSAIKAATNQEIDNYEDENPDLAKIVNRQRLEYCCVIPKVSRSKSSVTDSNPSPTLCERCEGRDAITRGLAYNEKVLKKIAEGSVALTLTQLGRDTTTSPQDFKNFLNDIYAYLSAWLMLSIKYDRPMPVKYIKQRYPKETNPDKRAYEKAIENIISSMIEIPEVIACLDPRHKISAVAISKEYLGTLIKLLKKPVH
jgi:hypothetical protein